MDQMTERPVLYLIDGSAYLYRAFFALPALSTSTGLPTNAVYGFTTMLQKIIREHRPDYLAVVFDEKGPTLRHVEFKEYKAHRPPMPDALSRQIPYIHRVVEAFAIPVVKLAGYEADDLIGALAVQAASQGLEVVIVTSDKDMCQLLSPAVRIYDPVKDRFLTEEDCLDRFGVEPARVVEVMGLMGDATDNIPGVKGIGEKTAIKLIAEFGTIEELLRRVEEVTAPKIRALLVQQADNARLSRQLATIHVDCPVEFDPERFQVRPPPTESLVTVLRELEFPTLLKAIHPTSPAAPDQMLGAKADIIRDEAGARRFRDGLARDEALGLHCVLGGAETTAITAELHGLALSAPGGTTVFAARLKPGSRQPLPPSLRDLLESQTRIKAVHDLKPVLLAFQRAGMGLTPPWFDTMIAAYLLNPNRRTHTLEAVALDALGYHVGAGQAEPATEAPTDLFEKADTATVQKAADAAVVAKTAEAAAAIIRLMPLLKARLEEQ